MDVQHTPSPHQPTGVRQTRHSVRLQGQYVEAFKRQSLTDHPTWSTVPGLSQRTLQLFESNGIKTPCQLMGQCFLLDRDSLQFRELLEDLGIETTQIDYLVQLCEVKLNNL